MKLFTNKDLLQEKSSFATWFMIKLLVMEDIHD